MFTNGSIFNSITDGHDAAMEFQQNVRLVHFLLIKFCASQPRTIKKIGQTDAQR